MRHAARQRNGVKLVAPTAKRITLRPLRPNIAVARMYQGALEAIIKEMAESVQYWIKATWRGNEPTARGLAQDATPINDLRRTLNTLSKRWVSRFDELSETLSERFADKSVRHTNAAMQGALREAGFTVKFAPSRQLTETMRSVIQENVSLIKSIPAQYLTKVETQVWRSVAAGHDLHTLVGELTAQYGVTYRRAKLIARDQNAKAHAAIEAVRRSEVGITRAVWVHSGAGKEPRPEHVKAGDDRLEFDVMHGAFLEGEWVRPGEAINCRCTSRSIIPGLEDFGL